MFVVPVDLDAGYEPCAHEPPSPVFFAVFMLWSGASLAAAEPRPELWMFPPASRRDATCASCLPSLMPGRRRVRGSRCWAMRTTCCSKQFSDDELRAWLPKIRESGLTLGLEVGCVKPWGEAAAGCLHQAKEDVGPLRVARRKVRRARLG